jgi:diguanylate cyclase (GGDEF)-like protein/PAS domain S-box-containing protein
VGAICPAAEAYAPAVALERASWLLAAGLSVVAAIGALWFLGASLRPLSRLVSQMESLATVEEFEPVAASFPRNENGRLAVAYDTPMLRLYADSERIEQSERMFRALTDSLPALIAYVDSSEHVRVMNATYKEWMGVDVKAAIGKTLEEVLEAELCAQRRDDLHAALDGQRREFDVVTTASGGQRHLHSVYLPDVRDDGRVAGLFSISVDVTEFKRVQVEREAQALRDTLTGLPNRRAFNALLAAAVDRRPEGLPMAIMFIDVDFFKKVNDSLGHAAGDAVLKEFARRLTHAVRPTDVTARMSGDEFVVLLEGVGSVAEVARIAEKVCRVAGEPMTLGTTTANITASIGVVFDNCRQEATAPALLAAAGDALYEAKDGGRNTYRLVEFGR